MAVPAAAKYPSVDIDTGDHTPIGVDEIVFTLRSRDAMSVPTVEAYYELCEASGSPPEHLAAIRRSIEEMTEWQRQNPEDVKIPD